MKSKQATVSASSITNALIYTRVSSDEQAREGLSLQAQLAACRRYVSLHEGWVIKQEYEDVMGGKRDERPNYQALLQEVRLLRSTGHAVTVVVMRLDRFGRRLLERVRCRDELKKLGVPTHSVADSGEISDLMANLLAAIDQEEVDRLSARVKESVHHSRSLGWCHPGRPPFGYCYRAATNEERGRGAPKSVLAFDTTTHAVAREALDRAASGETIRSISRWLAQLPEDQRGGCAWGKNVTHRMLISSTYAGLLPNGNKGNWPAMIDDEQHQQILDYAAINIVRAGRSSNRYLLTGFLTCHRCSSIMHGTAGGFRNNPRGERVRNQPRYLCSKSGGANGANSVDFTYCAFSVNQRSIDLQVLEIIGECMWVTMVDDQMQRIVTSEWNRLRKPHGTSPNQRIGILRSKIERSKQRIGGLATMLVDGDLDKEGYEAGRDQVRAVIEEAEKEIASLSREVDEVRLPKLQNTLNAMQGWSGILKKGTVEAQREILSALVAGVTLERIAYGKWRPVVAYTEMGQGLMQVYRAVHERSG